MKRLLMILVFLSLSGALLAQGAGPAAASAIPPELKVTTEASAGEPQTAPQAKPATQDRMFFPSDWIWGWGQFDIAPPHNEPDPNLCAANAGVIDNGRNARCNAFARYVLSGAVELRPFGQTVLRRVMAFFDPTLLFGKNVPQYLYTWDWTGIGMEYKYGVGVDLPYRFEFRFTGHPEIQRFSSRNLGPAYLGPNGPWGQYNTIGIRKYFGKQREGTH